jgi:hypothetical protein
VRSDLASVESEIKSAEADDTRYTGGLVKALIGTRIATLHQTEAMLEQKLLSLKQGIPVKYTVAGKVFTPPASAPQILEEVELEVAASEEKIRGQEAEAARYSGGLTQAMSLATLETMRQTHAMLEQKRVSLKYGLPQYIGFNDSSGRASSSPVASAPVPPPAVGQSDGEAQDSSGLPKMIRTVADESDTRPQPAPLVVTTDVAPVVKPIVNLAAFQEIKAGMSYGMVNTIIGTDGVAISRSDLAGHTTIMYSWKNSNGSNMNATFRDDSLVTKAQFGLQ